MKQIEAAEKISATEEFRGIVTEMFKVAATTNPGKPWNENIDDIPAIVKP